MPIPMKEEPSTNRTSITLVVVGVLCLAAFAYSNGWFGPYSPTTETEGNKASANQTLNQNQVKKDAASVTAQTMEPTGGAVE